MVWSTFWDITTSDNLILKMTLYLKYRPRILDDLDSVGPKESLKKIVSSRNIPQAFLFTGPKGIGKTSAARIMAAIVNCENIKNKIVPCGKCEQCKTILNGSNLDVIELDAASHRGIDDVRVLKDAVKLAPAKGKKKVYIIDEAHMLTLEASNALLKTLEEPPEHVMFILATTNPEKLIDTIKSRTTIINFKKATNEEILTSLKRVVKGEKIKIDQASLAVIAKYSDSSFRDAHKILEQIINENIKLSEEEIEKFLSTSLPTNITFLVDSILSKDTNKALGEVERLILKGANPRFLVEKLIEKFRQGLLGKMGINDDIFPDVDKDELVKLLNLLIKANRDLPSSYIEELPLELAIIAWGGDKKNKPFQNEDRIKNISEGKNINGSKKKVEKVDRDEKKEILTDIESNSKIIPGNIKEISGDIWDKILGQIKPINMSVEALLRAAKPLKFDGKTLTLGVYYRFHKERLEDVRNRKILEEVVEHVLSIPARVVCTLTEAPVKKEGVEQKKNIILTESEEDNIVKAAKDIFGNSN